MDKKVFKIKGMDCASCAITIEKAVKKIDDIADANVNFAAEKLFIKYHHQIPDEDIIKNVQKTGYKIFSEESENQPMEMHGEHDHAKMESDREINTLKSKLIFGIFASVVTMILSFGGSYVDFIPKNLVFIILLILATPVEFFVGAQFWRGSYYEFKNFRPGMDSLVAIGTGAAYFFSLAVAIVNLIPDLNKSFLANFEPYFDVAIVVVTFIILGKYLEAKAKGSASEAIKKLLKLQAKTAHLVDKTGKITDIDVNLVKIGDILLVKQGEKAPVDGIIIEGSASIDESMVTGESLPIDKKESDNIIGATINQSGIFKMRAVKIGKDTFLSQIIRIVEEAQASKASIQKLADKITNVFVPVVIVISASTFFSWMFFGPEPWLAHALVNAVAVLVVACPCALGLATPVAVITGTGKGAENGIIIKNANSLETAGKINAVILDKTGTITEGKPKVVSIDTMVDNSDELVKIAASLSQNSNHPLSRAVVEYARLKNIPTLSVLNFSEIAGKGVAGKIDGKKYFLGNKKLLGGGNMDIDAEINKKAEEREYLGETVIFLSSEEKALAIISIADTLKKSSKDAIKKINKLGIEVWMITGDNKKTADAIAKQVGIKNVLASVLPEQKSSKIKELQDKGKIVAMVGDGINDAPALAQANIGIAIGTGTDIAIESAGVTLVSGDPIGIYKTIFLSRKTLSNIRQNLFWAYAYNIALIPVAAGILYPLYGILLNPMLAGAAMALSSLSVVLNSLRLKQVKF